MKLSEALRQGSAGRKRIKGAFIDDNGDVCTLGAIAIGLGCTVYPFAIDWGNKVEWLTPELKKDIGRMNDSTDFTFAEIAQWLESADL